MYNNILAIQKIYNKEKEEDELSDLDLSDLDKDDINELYGKTENIIKDIPDEKQPEKIRNQVELISIDKNNSKIIGSLSYRIQPYASDIDVYESVSGCCSEEEVINKFIDGIYKIVNKFSNDNNRWFVEMKMGKDARYEMDLEKISISKLSDIFKSLYSRGLLEEHDYRNIYDIINKYMEESDHKKILENLSKFSLEDPEVLNAIEFVKGIYEGRNETLKKIADAYFRSKTLSEFRGTLFETIGDDVISDELEKNLSIYKNAVKHDIYSETISNIKNYYIKGSSNDRLDKCDIEEVSEILRKYLVLRWNIDDIKRGYKTIPSGIKGGIIKVYIRDTISNSGPINIEAIAAIDGKITDISNYFVLTFKYENDDNLYAINLPQNSIDDFNNYFISNLMKNIYNLSESCSINKIDYFKACKRIWSLCRFILKNFDDSMTYYYVYDDIAIRLAPLISGQVSHLNKIKSQIGVIKDLIKINPKNLPIDIIEDQIISMTSELQRITLLNDEQITTISDLFDAISNNLHVIINYDDVIDIMYLIIQEHTINYLLENNILDVDDNNNIHFIIPVIISVVDEGSYYDIFHFNNTSKILSFDD